MKSTGAVWGVGRNFLFRDTRCHIYIYVGTHLCTYTYVCVYAYMCACLYVRLHKTIKCMWVRTSLHTPPGMYTVGGRPAAAAPGGVGARPPGGSRHRGEGGGAGGRGQRSGSAAGRAGLRAAGGRTDGAVRPLRQQPPQAPALRFSSFPLQTWSAGRFSAETMVLVNTMGKLVKIWVSRSWIPAKTNLQYFHTHAPIPLASARELILLKTFPQLEKYQDKSLKRL